MKVKRMELSECEIIVMKCIWDTGGAMTCQEIIKKIKDEYHLDYSSTTVYTFLKYLQDKGFVKCKKNGLNYYEAIKEEKMYREAVMDRTKKFWFSGSSKKMISALIHSEKLDEADKEEIKRMIDELD